MPAHDENSKRGALYCPKLNPTCNPTLILDVGYLVGDELDVVVRVDEVSLGVQRLHVEPQPRRRYSAKFSLALAAPPLSQGKFGKQLLTRQSRAKSIMELIRTTE